MSRLSGEPKLLVGFELCFEGPMDEMGLEPLKDLVVRAGGRAVPTPTLFTFAKEVTRIIIVNNTEGKEDKSVKVEIFVNTNFK